MGLVFLIVAAEWSRGGAEWRQKCGVTREWSLGSHKAKCYRLCLSAGIDKIPNSPERNRILLRPG